MSPNLVLGLEISEGFDKRKKFLLSGRQSQKQKSKKMKTLIVFLGLLSAVFGMFQTFGFFVVWSLNE